MDSKLPVVITAYNRPAHLYRTLHTLQKCHSASLTDVFLFVDAPKANDIALGIKQQIDEVINSKYHFKRFITCYRDENMGLAGNVIDAVSSVMQQYPGAIVLEDDMLVNQYFLDFMNTSFEYYYDNQNIGCITGYAPPIKGISNISTDLFTSTRSSTWGWSMKSKDWLSIDWSKGYFQQILSDPDFIRKLAVAGNDRLRLLNAWLQNSLDIWGIRRGAWQVINNKLTLYPKYSMLTNIGLDGSGQNCSNVGKLTADFVADFKPVIYPKIDSYTPHAQNEKLIRQFYSRG